MAETIINDTNTITNLINNFKKLRNIDENESNESNENKEELPNDIDNELINMLKNLSSEKESIDENFLKDGLIGKLANELTNELNIDDLNIDMDNTNNIDDIFSNLVNGENSLKFMNLIQTVGNKIQTKVQNGEFQQNDLFNEAKKIMSNIQGGDNNLFNNILNQQQAPKSKTHERLKKKLEQKINNK